MPTPPVKTAAATPDPEAFDAQSNPLTAVDANGPDYALVQRQKPDGTWEYVGRVDYLIISGDQGLLEDHIQHTWGAGTYKIDPRKQGKRGSCGSPRIVGIAAPPRDLETARVEAHAAQILHPPPPPVGADVNSLLLTLLTAQMQNNQAMFQAAMQGMNQKQELGLKELLPLLLQRSSVSELGDLLKLSRSLSGEVGGGGGGGGDDGGILGAIAGKVIDLIAQQQQQQQQSASTAPALAMLPAPAMAPGSLAPSWSGTPANGHRANDAAGPIPPPAAIPSPASLSAQRAPPPATVEPKMSVTAGAALASLETFIGLLHATRNHERREPDAYASVLADALGDDEIETILQADNLSIINHLRALSPTIAGQELFIAQVADAARSMYGVPPLSIPARVPVDAYSPSQPTAAPPPPAQGGGASTGARPAR